MANYLETIPLIKKWEGGYVDYPNDNGGCTMQGVTIATFRHYYGEKKTCSDLKRITEEQWGYIFKNGYWDVCKADEINNQSIANIIVDWAWMSGPRIVAKKIQEILKVPADGIIGKQTLAALNSADQKKLFESIYKAREVFYENICEKKPSQRVFLKGWLNRLKDYTYSENITIKENNNTKNNEYVEKNFALYINDTNAWNEHWMWKPEEPSNN